MLHDVRTVIRLRYVTKIPRQDRVPPGNQWLFFLGSLLDGLEDILLTSVNVALMVPDDVSLAVYNENVGDVVDSELTLELSVGVEEHFILPALALNERLNLLLVLRSVVERVAVSTVFPSRFLSDTEGSPAKAERLMRRATAENKKRLHINVCI